MNSKLCQITTYKFWFTSVIGTMLDLQMPNWALASKMSNNQFLQDQLLDRMIHSQGTPSSQDVFQHLGDLSCPSCVSTEPTRLALAGPLFRGGDSDSLLPVLPWNTGWHLPRLAGMDGPLLPGHEGRDLPPAVAGSLRFRGLLHHRCRPGWNYRGRWGNEWISTFSELYYRGLCLKVIAKSLNLVLASEIAL